MTNSEKLTDEELAGLARLLSRATPGPWSSLDVQVRDNCGNKVATAIRRVAPGAARDNAAAICAAINALPRLIATVRRPALDREEVEDAARIIDPEAEMIADFGKRKNIALAKAQAILTALQGRGSACVAETVSEIEPRDERSDFLRRFDDRLTELSGFTAGEIGVEYFDYRWDIAIAAWDDPSQRGLGPEGAAEAEHSRTIEEAAALSSSQTPSVGESAPKGGGQ